MGREIRRVIPNWEHPRHKCTHSLSYGGCTEAKLHGGYCYKPLLDETYEDASILWRQNLIAWNNGTHEALERHPEYKDEMQYWEWDSPPSPDYYRPKWLEEPTWVQVYETVSEGTPVTPPFATKEELVEYLVEYGDFWDQHDNAGGWTRANAEAFVRDEYAPSMIAIVTDHSIDILMPRDGTDSG